jgi:hypothetical protein
VKNTRLSRRSPELSASVNGRVRPCSQVAWQVVLAEVVALRTIVVNLHVALCRGETLSADAIQRLIDLADREKNQRARGLLEGARRAS